MVVTLTDVITKVAHQLGDDVCPKALEVSCNEIFDNVTIVTNLGSRHASPKDFLFVWKSELGQSCMCSNFNKLAEISWTNV